MAQAMINFRMDEELKKNMEETWKKHGRNMQGVRVKHDDCIYNICKKNDKRKKNSF